MEEAVVLMAKAPVAGRVKTRLCPPLDPRESAALYACMLGDTADEVSILPRVRRYLFLDPPESTVFPRREPVFRVRAVSAARAGPRGQDAGRGRDRIPARGASRGDRGGGLPFALRGDGPPGVPGAFHRGVGRLRPLGGRRILPGRPLLAGRTAVPGIPMEHRGGAPERGGALQDPFGAVLVPASRAGRGHRGGPSRTEGVGEDARAARVPPDPRVDHRFLWAGRRRIPRAAGTNTRSSPRFTISPRRVTDFTPFGTSISNAPDSPRKSAPSPRNGDFGKTRFRSVLPSPYRNSAITPMERRERSGMSSPRLTSFPFRRTSRHPSVPAPPRSGRRCPTERRSSPASGIRAPATGQGPRGGPGRRPSPTCRVPGNISGAAESVPGEPAVRGCPSRFPEVPPGTGCRQYGQSGTSPGIWIVQCGQLM